MNHEDNERHFKAWLDKNSWRRDLQRQRLEKEYGAAPRRTPGLASGADGAGSTGATHRAALFTDEFTVPVMDVIHHLLEAFLFVPRGECSRCGAEIRVSRNDRGPHLCTVDSMLDSL